MTEHLDVVDRRRRHLRHQRGLASAGPLPVQELRRPGAPRRPRWHLGPVPIPRDSLRLGHVHPGLPLQAVGVVDLDRRRRLDQGLHQGSRDRERHRQAHPLPAQGAGRRVVRCGEPMDAHRRQQRAAAGAHLLVPVRVQRLLQLRRGLPAEVRGLRRLRGHHHSSAALAGGSRLRRQEDRGDRLGRYRDHTDSFAGEFGRRSRDDAAALTVLHRIAAAERPVRRAGQQVAANQGCARREPVEVDHVQHLPIPVLPEVPAPNAQDAADDGQAATAAGLRRREALRPELQAVGPAAVPGAQR